MTSSVKIVISRASLKKGSELSLPSFSTENINKEQAEALTDILINEYFNYDKRGDDAN